MTSHGLKATMHNFGPAQTVQQILVAGVFMTWEYLAWVVKTFNGRLVGGRGANINLDAQGTQYILKNGIGEIDLYFDGLGIEGTVTLDSSHEDEAGHNWRVIKTKWTIQ